MNNILHHSKHSKVAQEVREVRESLPLFSYLLPVYFFNISLFISWIEF